MVTSEDRSLDEVILQVFEEHEESFHFPVATQKEARAFVKALHGKGLSYDCLLLEIKELEQNFSAWRKGISRSGIGNRVIERINRPLQEILHSDGEEEDPDCLDQLSTDSGEVERNYNGIEIKKNGEHRLAADSKSNVKQTGNGTDSQKKDKSDTCLDNTSVTSAKKDACKSLGESNVRVYDKAVDVMKGSSGKTEAGKDKLKDGEIQQDVVQEQTKQGSSSAENEIVGGASGKSLKIVEQKQETTTENKQAVTDNKLIAVTEKKQEVVTEKKQAISVNKEEAVTQKKQIVTENKKEAVAEKKQEAVTEKKQEAVTEKKQAAVVENKQEAVTEKKQEAVTEKKLEAAAEKKQEAVTEKKQEAIIEKKQEAVIEKKQGAVIENKQEAATEKKQEAAAEKKQEAVTEKKQEAFIEKKQEAVTEKKQEAVMEKKQAAVTEKKQEAVVEKKQEAVTEKKQEAVTEKKQEAVTEKKQELIAEKKQEGKLEAVTEKKQEAVTEKKQEAVVEKKQEAVTEKKQEAVTEKKQAAVTEKKQEAFVEKKQEAVTEKKQEAVTEKKQEAVAEKKQDGIAEKKQAVTEGKLEAVTEKKQAVAELPAELAGTEKNCESEYPKKEVAGIAAQCISEPPIASNAAEEKLEDEKVSVMENVSLGDVSSQNGNSEIDSKSVVAHAEPRVQAQLPAKVDTTASVLVNSSGADAESHSSTSDHRSQSKFNDILESYDSDLDAEFNHDDVKCELTSDDPMTNRCKPCATNESQVGAETAGYVYVFTDSSAEKGEIRVKVGASRYPHRKLQQSLLFNIDMKLVSAVQVSDRRKALSAVHEKLSVFSIPKTAGWFCGPLESILNVLMAVVKDYPHQN